MHNGTAAIQLLEGFDLLAHGFTAVVAGLLFQMGLNRDVVQSLRLAGPQSVVLTGLYLPGNPLN
jgi:hypothetical protein